MHQHRLESDPETIYEQRRNRFLHVIKKYRTGKLKEINDKADRQQEFELNKIKKQGDEKNTQYVKKIQGQLKVSKKIFESRKINECKMQEMRIRFDMIERIQEEAKDNLRKKTEDQKQYKNLIKQLIKQGLIKLLEEEVEIRCIKKDEKLVTEALEQTLVEFNKECQVQCKAIINKNNYLTESDIGGIILTSFKGKIVCDNTFKARLNYCSQIFLPEIRKLMFEKSDQFLSKRKVAKLQEAKQIHHQKEQQLVTAI